MTKYTDQQRIQALKQLANFRGQPLVIRYRDSTRRALVYAGGRLQLRKGKPPVWDGEGVEISKLIAIAVNSDDYDENGVNVEQYYTHGYVSGKGIGLINQLNQIAIIGLGGVLFDANNASHVNARGTML